MVILCSQFRVLSYCKSLIKRRKAQLWMGEYKSRFQKIVSIFFTDILKKGNLKRTCDIETNSIMILDFFRRIFFDKSEVPKQLRKPSTARWEDGKRILCSVTFWHHLSIPSYFEAMFGGEDLVPARRVTKLEVSKFFLSKTCNFFAKNLVEPVLLQLIKRVSWIISGVLLWRLEVSRLNRALKNSPSVVEKMENI